VTQIVLFGGVQSDVNDWEQAILNDTWVYHPELKVWQRDHRRSPPPCYGHTLATIPVKVARDSGHATAEERVLLFGGANSTGKSNSQLWQFSPTSTAASVWQEIAPEPCLLVNRSLCPAVVWPTARTQHVSVGFNWGGDGVMFVHGGFTDARSRAGTIVDAPDGAASVSYWLYNYSSDAWARHACGTGCPPALAQHTATHYHDPTAGLETGVIYLSVAAPPQRHAHKLPPLASGVAPCAPPPTPLPPALLPSAESWGGCDNGVRVGMGG